jgi:phosphoribosyl-AMP cyclohydrolase
MTSAGDLEEGSEFCPRHDRRGLIPAIAQDFETGEVLMLAITTGEAHYWSRSRQKLWRKGETSGETQEVVELRVDCDQDSLLMKIRQKGKGVACHTGRKSCFYRRVEGNTLHLVKE